jgi:hypothetical protein
MGNRTQSGVFALVFAIGLTGCEGTSPVSPTPSAPTAPSSPTATLPSTVPASPTLIAFTDPGTGLSTSELRDAQEQVLQINTAGELIWTADGTHLPGYRVDRCCYPAVSYIVGKICAEGCVFEVRFGTKDGKRRAYLTADYGHDNPGTLVDVEVSGGALVVTRTSVFVPGSLTLVGVITEATSAGIVPVAGVAVYCFVGNDTRAATTDRNGFYTLLGMLDATVTVVTIKEGYAETEHKNVKSDTRFDIRLVRQ